MTYPIQWADRPCNHCSRKLGCPHSKMAGEFQVPAPAWLQSMYIQKNCRVNILREDSNDV